MRVSGTIQPSRSRVPRVNDLARVIQSGGTLGPTLYLVDWVGERGYCTIREAGNPLAGSQEFDLSLLEKVER
jgi:hypothetical protein